MTLPLCLYTILTLFLLTKSEWINERIIGGQDATDRQFPFAAAINVQTSNSKFFCGGSLIGEKWILTAGNCVYNATLFTIQLGSNTLTKTDPNRITLTSSEYVIHPEFDPTTTKNDLGIIVLESPVTYNDYIQPIDIPTLNLYNRTPVTTIGWGQTSDSNSDLSENLKFTPMTIISNVECKVIYGDQIFDTMVCGVGNNNEGTCTSDNGGPVVEYLGKYTWVVAVSSFLSGNGCESSDPSGFTNTRPYLGWIYGIMYPFP